MQEIYSGKTLIIKTLDWFSEICKSYAPGPGQPSPPKKLQLFEILKSTSRSSSSCLKFPVLGNPVLPESI